jgi:hypothetical protein
MRRLILLVTLPLLLDGIVALALAGAPPARPDGIAAGRGAGAAYAVFFDWDQATLSPHARATLAAASRMARAGHDARLDMLAAEEPNAGPAYVAALGQARWASIAAALRQEGVEPGRLVHAGLGRAIILGPRPPAGLIASVAQDGAGSAR